MNKETNNLPILQEGDTGNDVIILQNKLKILGFYDASVTGGFGVNTTNAVKMFQNEYGLDPTGIVDDETWDVLYEETSSPFPINDDIEARNLRASKPTLRLGDTGEFVVQLQQQLKQLLYYEGEINGVFDTLTETAIKVFQTTNKLTANGIVGVDTWSALAFLYSPLSICEDSNDEEIIHIVRRGDTLYSIARSYGVSVDDVKRLNNLTTNTLSIGQRLLIKEGSSPDINKDEQIYVVGRGDTLYSIAIKFNTTVDNIKNLNSLTSNVITIGEELIVPSSIESDNLGIYIVQRGDTLYSIARSYGISVDELKRLNNLTSNILTIGQSLDVPVTDDYTIYVVKRGDTLYSIARNYGVNVNDIKSLNNLSDSVITIGEELLIPNV